MAEETKQESALPPGCSLWVGWMLASVVGSGIGWMSGWRFSFQAPGAWSTYVIGAAVGLSLGLLQWLVLRGQIEAASWWILASLAGWGAGFPAGIVLAQQLGLTGVLFGLVVGGAVGLLTGLAEWVLLRRTVPQAGWWVPASLFAWTSSLLYYQPGATLVGVLYGLLSGIVTGTVLMWLLYRPVD